MKYTDGFEVVLDLTDGGDDMSISCVTGILSGVALIFLLTDGEGASILDEDLTGSLGVFTTTLLAFLELKFPHQKTRKMN